MKILQPPGYAKKYATRATVERNIRTAVLVVLPKFEIKLLTSLLIEEYI